MRAACGLPHDVGYRRGGTVVIRREHMYDWDGLWAAYEPLRFGEPRRGQFELPGAARHAFSHPASSDAAWLAASLRDERRKWLVAEVARRATVPEPLFQPMLEAAIDEANPSFNRSFVEP